MNTFNKLVCGFVFGTILSGCGAEGFEEEAVSDRYSGPRINDNNRDIGLAEISGIWEANVEITSLVNDQIIGDELASVDEFVMVITEQGRYLEYDYKGDSQAERAGEYGNCYVKQYDATIEKKPEGGFSLIEESESEGFIFTFSTDTNFDIKEGKLVSALSPFIWDCKCDPQIIHLPRSSLTIEDLESMLCES